MGTNDEQIIGDIRKNDKEFIRISIRKYNKYLYVDIRLYFTNEKGEEQFTKKGVTVSPVNLGRFVDLINSARRELNKNNTSGSPY